MQHDYIYLFLCVSCLVLITDFFIHLSFFVVLSVCIYVLLYVALIQPQRRTVIIENINPDIFNQLYLEYADTLSCPCSTAAISYDTFVSNEVILHPICSSFFITQQWIDALYVPTASRLGVSDFRTTAKFQVSLRSSVL